MSKPSESEQIPGRRMNLAVLLGLLLLAAVTADALISWKNGVWPFVKPANDDGATVVSHNSSSKSTGPLFSSPDNAKVVEGGLPRAAGKKLIYDRLEGDAAAEPKTIGGAPGPASKKLIDDRIPESP